MYIDGALAMGDTPRRTELALIDEFVGSLREQPVAASAAKASEP
jgi:hypothetical protein